MTNLFDSLMGGVGTTLLMQTQGRSVVYRQAGCQPVTLTALVGDEEIETRHYGDTTEKVRKRTFTFTRRRSGPRRGVVEPRLNDTIEYEGKLYTVESQEAADEHLVRVVAIVDASQYVGSPGLRGKN